MKCVVKNKILLIVIIMLIIISGSCIYYIQKISHEYNISSINKYNENFCNLVDSINSVESLLAKAIISKNVEFSAKTLTQIWRDSNLALIYLGNIPSDSNEMLRNIKVFKSS